MAVTREEAARFIEQQMNGGRDEPREKWSRHHYGYQEARTLLDFIYGGLPSKEEEIRNRDAYKSKF
jgi:hypothetical protein